ncbi:MAG TPA: tail fiber protein [Conexibacter sp.]|nr:tail fiber protein [Conexibacter sp.]
MAEPFLGEIRMFGGDFAPRGWAHCHGQLLPIAEHAPLYSLIGTTYGGDGIETFALPDLRQDSAPRTPLPLTYIIALAGVYPARP